MEIVSECVIAKKQSFTWNLYDQLYLYVGMLLIQSLLKEN